MRLTLVAGVVNSCSLIGMPPSQAKDALTVNPQRAILRGRASRRSLCLCCEPSLSV